MKNNFFEKFIRFISIISLLGVSSPALAAPPDQAVGYWNEALMKSAKPFQLLMNPKTGIAELSEIQSNLTTPETGADWTDGGLPQSAVGKVFFTIGRSNYVCSGSLINDGSFLDSRSVVVTAGHCVISGGKFVTNFMFVPNYDQDILDGSISTSNRYYAQNLVVKQEFASQRQFNTTAIQHDWAFAVIRTGTFTKNRVRLSNPSTQLDAVAGAFDYMAPGFTAVGNIATAFGYPQAAPYNGRELKYARGGIFLDPNGYGTWGMNSTLTGGASGGPWLSYISPLLSAPTTGAVSSVNSYKYTNDTSRMYGPLFNSKTTQTLSAALNIGSTSTSDLIVP